MALLHAISIFCEVYDDEVPAEQLLKDLQQVEYRALLYLGFDLIYTFALPAGDGGKKRSLTISNNAHGVTKITTF